jgi:two-component system, sensor histidine kinase PdtaS
MTQAKKPKRGRLPVYDRLGARLALLVALAMLPLGFLGLVQSKNFAAEANSRTALATMDETMRAASPEIRLIAQAQTIARTMSHTILAMTVDPVACSKVLAETAAESPEFSLLAFLPLNGLMTCSSKGEAVDLSKNASVNTILAMDEPGFLVNRAAEVSGTSVLAMSHPVYDAKGVKVGAIAVSLPHLALTEEHKSELTAAAASDTDLHPIALITFDAGGEILTSSIGLDEAPLRIPAQTSLIDLAKSPAKTFRAVSVAGNDRVYSITPIVDGLFLLGVWDDQNSASIFGIKISPLVFPGLMWVAAMLVALLAAEHLVARHMRKIAQAMNAFAAGEREQMDLDLASSPAEIRNLGQSYEVLTETILRDEAELENMVRQKEMLLREVHHRTGNSMQLIASIMRMHMRQEQANDAARTILHGLHDRVMGLATVHLGLYQTAGQKDVQMDALFDSVVQQIRGMGEGDQQKPQILTDFEPLRLIPDQAVPLALLLAELLAGLSLPECALKDGASTTVEVDLRLVDEGEAELHIFGPVALGGDSLAQPTTTHIGTQLVRGFAQQIGGILHVANAADYLDVKLVFPVKEAAT